MNSEVLKKAGDIEICWSIIGVSPAGRLKVDLLSTVTAATIDSHSGRTYLSCVGGFFLLLFPLGSLRQHILRVNSPCSGAASYVNCFRKCSCRRNVISNNSTGISQFTQGDSRDH